CMAYRNGMYMAFHAEGRSNPADSDMRCLGMLKAWYKHEDIEFRFIDSHEKTGALRDNCSRARLRDVLAERLRNSRNMVLVIGPTTRFDTDWVPFEIEYAVDVCEIPIIAAYTGYEYIGAPHLLAYLWPSALADRIQSTAAHVIHVPFK